MVYNLYMPISTFAVQIAHALADYFVDDNTVALPDGYQYGADNTAVLNPYSVSNLGQKAYGIASATLSRFWSTPSPSPHSYHTPTSSNYLSVPGIEGLDRALQMAQHFGLIRDATQGENLVDCLKSIRSEGANRTTRSDLVGNLGFDIIDPQHSSGEQISIQDCKNILSFLTHPDNWKDKKSGKRILKAIQEFFKISDERVNEEKQKTLDSFVNVEDYVFLGQDDSPTPRMFIDPRYADCKLIYEKACQIIHFLESRVSASPSLHTYRQRSLSNHSVSAEPPPAASSTQFEFT